MALNRRNWFAVARVVAMVGWVTNAFAQSAFPSQTISLVVPYLPGGSTDKIARLYAEGMTKVLKQSFVVAYCPGASTNIGSEAVPKANTDGYSLILGGSVLTMNTVFGPKPSFDQRTDFLHFPYKGGVQTATDAMGGQVQSVFPIAPVLQPQVQAEKLRAVGITAAQRLTCALPEVATIKEYASDYVMGVGYGLQAQAGLSVERRDILNSATRKVLEPAEFSSKLEMMGAHANAGTPEELTQQLAQQRRTWKQLAATYPKLMKSELL